MSFSYYSIYFSSHQKSFLLRMTTYEHVIPNMFVSSRWLMSGSSQDGWFRHANRAFSASPFASTSLDSHLVS